MRDHGRVKRLAFVLTVNVVVLAGCAFLREGDEANQPLDAELSPAVPPVASASPAASSDGPAGPGSSSNNSPTPRVTSSPAPRTAKPGESVGSVILTGTLGFDSAEGGCAYLEADSGERYQVVYPDGWQVDRGTRHLVGADGTDAPPGSIVSVRGSIAADMASICQVGPIFRAIEVISVGR